MSGRDLGGDDGLSRSNMTHQWKNWDPGLPILSSFQRHLESSAQLCMVRYFKNIHRASARLQVDFFMVNM
jgi:hypothetical protein